MDNIRYNKIVEMANSSKKIHLTTNNSKCGKACLCLSLPCCVCRADAPCKKECYCMKGTQQFNRVLASYYRNLFLYQNDKNDFFKQLDNAIKFYSLPLFRFFDAGDIVDSDFFYECIKVVKKNKQVKFLMYTKKYNIVNDYIKNGGKIPNNLVIRFSCWSKGWQVPNPYNLPLTYVNFTDATKNVETMTGKLYECHCNGVTCSQCKKCFNKDYNIIFDQH